MGYLACTCGLFAHHLCIGMLLQGWQHCKQGNPTAVQDYPATCFDTPTAAQGHQLVGGQVQARREVLWQAKLRVSGMQCHCRGHTAGSSVRMFLQHVESSWTCDSELVVSPACIYRHSDCKPGYAEGSEASTGGRK
jgi:uncharacterized protein YfaP (DUF2135 family)